MLSQSERSYIESGIHSNLRADGRPRLSFRPFTLQTQVIPQASGSCKLTLTDPQPTNRTDVLVGIKVEIGDILSLDHTESPSDLPLETSYLPDSDSLNGIQVPEMEGLSGPLNPVINGISQVSDSESLRIKGCTQNRGRVICNVEW